jgi:hypothetical protein
MRSVRTSAVLVTVLGAISIGCPGSSSGTAEGGTATTAAAAIPDCTPAALPAAPAGAVAPTIPSRVFVDVAPTMAGFTGAGDRANALRKVHQVIDTALGEAGAGPPRRCSLGAKWQRVKKHDCTEEETDPNKCWVWIVSKPVDCDAKVGDWGAPTTYSALHDTSKLDAVLIPVPRPAKIDPDHPPAPDLVDEANATIVVASGIEPGPLPGAAETSAAACTQGSGPGCIAAALLERVKAGYGVWIVELMASFQGSYTADVPVDAKYKQGAAAHFAAIKQVAAGESTAFPGIDFKITGQDAYQRKGLAHSRFQYSGVRPLVLIVLSRKPEMGRKIVASLTEKLRADPVLRPGKMTPESIVQSAELAPLSIPRFTIGSVDLVPREQQGLEPAVLSELRVEEKGATEKGGFARVWCGSKGQSWFEAKWSKATQSPELPPFVRSTTALAGPFSNVKLPDKVSMQRANPDASSARVFLSCVPLAPRPDMWAVEYHLRAKTDLDEAGTQSTWWAKGSSPNSYEMPEKVYGLKEIATALLKATVTRESCESRVRLNVKRVE